MCIWWGNAKDDDRVSRYFSVDVVNNRESAPIVEMIDWRLLSRLLHTANKAE